MREIAKEESTLWRVLQARYKLCSLFMFDSTIVGLELLTNFWHLLHMAIDGYIIHDMIYPHAQCAHTHLHSAAQGIMRMRSPSTEYSRLFLQWHCCSQRISCTSILKFHRGMVFWNGFWKPQYHYFYTGLIRCYVLNKLDGSSNRIYIL